MTISKNSNTQLADIGESNNFYLTFITKAGSIKELDHNSNKVDDIDIIDVNSIRSIKISKLAKFKIFV